MINQRPNAQNSGVKLQNEIAQTVRNELYVATYMYTPLNFLSCWYIHKLTRSMEKNNIFQKYKPHVLSSEPPGGPLEWGPGGIVPQYVF